MLPIEPIVPITSREYKIMLSVHAPGIDRDPDPSALREVLEQVGEGMDLPVDGPADDERTERAVWFLDTTDHWLRQQGYALRCRHDDDDEVEVTLKVRHWDRYFVQSQILPAKKSKFEQDIKPPNVSLYSFSSKKDLSTKMKRPVDTLGELSEEFAGLEQRLPAHDGTRDLEVVNEFIAREMVVPVADIELPGAFTAESALILWWGNDEADPSAPLLAEFSFRYPTKKWTKEPPAEPQNYFDGVSGYAAATLFKTLQRHLAKSDWLPDRPVTKTTFVYESRSS